MRLRLWQLIAVVFAGVALISAASGVITGLLIKDGINSSNKAQAARLFRAQVSGCYRQNIRTVAANKNALATFLEDTLFAGAVATPRPGASKKERRLTLDFHARLENEIETLTWAPVVSACSVAPTTVELPVTFSRRQPPLVDLRLSRATAGPYITASR